MPSLEVFIESLTQEQNKLINMGKINGPVIAQFAVRTKARYEEANWRN
jgi:hypothetical protein